MDCHNSDAAYQEALGWLFSQLPMFSRIGAAAYKPGLDNTLALDALYGHPHRHFKSIHVGGTNGKGSTSHMLAAVLQSQGYRTGLYTSPHLTDFRERIRIDGKMIPKEEVVRFVSDWRGRKNPDVSPSFFELTMMMAFEWFAREGVDYAVVEVGMGGRLDSTNVITPLLSVITNISFDHTQFLGSTLEAIAAEKAGIIKEGVPVVVGEAEGAVREVFEARAAEVGAPVFFAREGNALPESLRSEIRVPLEGTYQKKNLLTVECALGILRALGVKLSDESILSGLASVDSLTGLRGRWQIVGERPLVICDTGHNVAGLSETTAALADRFPGKQIRFVIGFVNDKDVAHIVDLFPADGEYFFTRASIPRAMPQEEVAAHFARRGIIGKTFPTVKEAFLAARDGSLPDDVIYVGGSTFVVADFLAFAEK